MNVYIIMNTAVFVKNVTAPICKTCKHLVMDQARPKDYLFARCVRFGEQCRISGEVKYYYADRCRRDYTLCGIEGKFHKPI
jgi:hypothetical protein